MPLDGRRIGIRLERCLGRCPKRCLVCLLGASLSVVSGAVLNVVLYAVSALP